MTWLDSDERHAFVVCQDILPKTGQHAFKIRVMNDKGHIFIGVCTLPFQHLTGDRGYYLGGKNKQGWSVQTYNGHFLHAEDSLYGFEPIEESMTLKLVYDADEKSLFGGIGRDPLQLIFTEVAGDVWFAMSMGFDGESVEILDTD